MTPASLPQTRDREQMYTYPPIKQKKLNAGLFCFVIHSLYADLFSTTTFFSVGFHLIISLCIFRRGCVN